MRVIPSRVPTVDDLQLPPVLKRIADEERGLILVTGTTGSGKSTSLAAMLNHINNTRATHIMTVEDPIEYLHRDNKSIINQREVRTDTSRSRRRCAARCVRTPTSCWSAKCAIWKRWKRRCWPRKRPPRVLDPAHARRAGDHQPYHRGVPAASAAAGAPAAREHAQGGDLAAPDAAREQPGRIAAVEVMIATPFIRDCILDKDKTHRSSARSRPARRSTGCRRSISRSSRTFRRASSRMTMRCGMRQQGRVQAEGPGYRDDIGIGARRNAQGQHRRRIRNHAVRRLTRHSQARGPAKCRAAAAFRLIPRVIPRVPTYDKCVDAYTQALTWLARRELSERQVRERLARREFDEDSIDTAVARLKTERALDDRRVALACARSAVRLKGRGRARVQRSVESLGIPRDLARAAVDEVFGEIDESALIERALNKRWPRTPASAGDSSDSADPPAPPPSTAAKCSASIKPSSARASPPSA